MGYLMQLFQIFFVNACFYLCLYFAVWWVLKSYKILRWVMPVGVIGVLCVGIPLFVNQTILSRYQSITKWESDLLQPVEPAGVILLNITEKSKLGGSNTRCTALCSSLLYGGMFKTVVMRTPEDSQKSTTFSLKNREQGGCYALPVYDQPFQGLNQGYCIKAQESDLKDVRPDYVYTLSRLRYPERFAEARALVASVEAVQLVLVDMRNNEAKTIYKKTGANVSLFKVPLQVIPGRFFLSSRSFYRNIYDSFFDPYSWFARHKLPPDKLGSPLQYKLDLSDLDRNRINKENEKIFENYTRR